VTTPRNRPLADRFRSWGSVAWSVVGVLVLVTLGGYLLWRIRVVAVPVFVAIIIAVALAPVVRWLEKAKLNRGLATLLTLLAAIGAVVAFGFLVAPSIADQFAGVDDAIDEAADRLQEWVEDERPFGATGDDVQRLRDRIEGVEIGEAADVAGVSPITGVRYAATAVTAILLAFVSTFFLLRDGPSIRNSFVRTAEGRFRGRAADLIDGAAGGLRGFLAGAAALGIVEGIAVGLTLWLTGSELGLVMGVITFLGAFVPFVGAIVAGALAVGVALVTGGTSAALVVGIVILVIQQLDNDLLAPLIYGRFLQLHPLAVILATTIGIETAGVLGAFVTVPLVAAATGAWKGWMGQPPSNDDQPPGNATPAGDAEQPFAPATDESPH
jgi:predicted PurR-regulated permease PerM